MQIYYTNCNGIQFTAVDLQSDDRTVFTRDKYKWLKNNNIRLGWQIFRVFGMQFMMCISIM